MDKFNVKIVTKSDVTTLYEVGDTLASTTDGEFTFILLKEDSSNVDSFYIAYFKVSFNVFCLSNVKQIKGSNVVIVNEESARRLFEKEDVIFDNSKLVLFNDIDILSSNFTDNNILCIDNDTVNIDGIILESNLNTSFRDEADIFEAIYSSIGYENIFTFNGFTFPLDVQDLEMRFVNHYEVIVRTDGAVLRTPTTIEVQLGVTPKIIKTNLNLLKYSIVDVDYGIYTKHISEQNLIVIYPEEDRCKFDIRRTIDVISNGTHATFKNTTKFIGILNYDIDDLDIRKFIPALNSLEERTIINVNILEREFLFYCLLHAKSNLKHKIYKHTVRCMNIHDVYSMYVVHKDAPNANVVNLDNTFLYPSFKLLANEFTEFKNVFKKHRVEMKDNDVITLLMVNGLNSDISKDLDPNISIGEMPTDTEAPNTYKVLCNDLQKATKGILDKYA